MPNTFACWWKLQGASGYVTRLEVYSSAVNSLETNLQAHICSHPNWTVLHDMRPAVRGDRRRYRATATGALSQA
jgi:hypothetical protein